MTSTIVVTSGPEKVALITGTRVSYFDTHLLALCGLVK